MKIGRTSVSARGSSKRNGLVTGEMNWSKQWSLRNRPRLAQGPKPKGLHGEPSPTAPQLNGSALGGGPPTTPGGGGTTPGGGGTGGGAEEVVSKLCARTTVGGTAGAGALSETGVTA